MMAAGELFHTQSRTSAYTAASWWSWLCAMHAVCVLSAPASSALSRGLITSSHGDHQVAYRGVPNVSSVAFSAVRNGEPGIISWHDTAENAQKNAVLVPWFAPASDTMADSAASPPRFRT